MSGLYLGVKKRVQGWKLAGVAVGMLVLQSVFLQVTAGAEGVWWMLCMALAIAFMYAFLAICCDISLKDVGYYCVRAFVTAEFAASLEWQLDCFGYFSWGWTQASVKGAFF